MAGTSSGPAAVYLSMKRLLPFLALLALLLPGAARAAACSPLNCAPSQFALAHGTLLGFRTAALRPVKVVDLRTGALEVHAARRVRGRERARPPDGQDARMVRREHRRANAHARSCTHDPPRGRLAGRVARRRLPARSRRRDDGRDRGRERSTRARDPRAAVGLRRAARQQALPHPLPLRRRLPGPAPRPRTPASWQRSRSRTRTSPGRSGARRSRASPRRTGATCSRSTSARTAAR